MAEPSIKPGSDLIVKTYFPKAKTKTNEKTSNLFSFFEKYFFLGRQVKIKKITTYVWMDIDYSFSGGS